MLFHKEYIKNTPEIQQNSKKTYMGIVKLN